MPGRRGRWRASVEPLGEPSNEVGASHQTRLGEPVLRGRWASQYSLGEPVLIGRVRTPWAWANPYWANHSTTFTVANACPCLALCLLGTSTSACSARLLKCLLGTASACSARSVPTYKYAYLQVPARRVYLQVPARHCACSARLIKCPLGTAPARHRACSARLVRCPLGAAPPPCFFSCQAAVGRTSWRTWRWEAGRCRAGA